MSAPLKERLVAVESSQDDGFNPAYATTNWYRNPDGPEALARIEALEAENAALKAAYERTSTQFDQMEQIASRAIALNEGTK